MKGSKGTIILFVLLALAWLLITSSFEPGEVLAGVVVVLVVVLATGRHRQVYGGIRLSFRAVLYTPLYLMVFLWQLIKSNLDVARRVVSPSLPIRPGIVCAKTQLKSSIGKLILANSITLTPGTLTLDIEDDTLLIHWIDVQGESCDESTQAIVAGFEKSLKEVVE